MLGYNQEWESQGWSKALTIGKHKPPSVRPEHQNYNNHNHHNAYSQRFPFITSEHKFEVKVGYGGLEVSFQLL